MGSSQSLGQRSDGGAYGDGILESSQRELTESILREHSLLLRTSKGLSEPEPRRWM